MCAQENRRSSGCCRSGGSREDCRVTSDGALRSLHRPFAPAGAPTETGAAMMCAQENRRSSGCCRSGGSREDCRVTSDGACAACTAHSRLPALLQKPARRRSARRRTAAVPGVVGAAAAAIGCRVMSDGGLRSLHRPFAPAGAPTETGAAMMCAQENRRSSRCCRSGGSRDWPPCHERRGLAQPAPPIRACRRSYRNRRGDDVRAGEPPQFRML